MLHAAFIKGMSFNMEFRIHIRDVSVGSELFCSLGLPSFLRYLVKLSLVYCMLPLFVLQIVVLKYVLQWQILLVITSFLTFVDHLPCLTHSAVLMNTYNLKPTRYHHIHGISFSKQCIALINYFVVMWVMENSKSTVIHQIMLHIMCLQRSLRLPLFHAQFKLCWYNDSGINQYICKNISSSYTHQVVKQIYWVI
jgi:hypothetical protein